MQRSNLMNAAILALGLVSACGGGGSSVAIDQVGAKFAQASCAKIFACCDAAERTATFMNFNPPPTTAAECEQTFGALLTLGFSSSQASVQAGRESYDGNAAGACIDTLTATACADLHGTPVPSTCDQMLTGKVASGGACAQSDECSGSAFCQGVTSGHVDGVCTTLPASGEACPDFQCAKGSYCNSSMMCAAPQADGQTCHGNDECQSTHCDMPSGMCVTPPATCDGM